MTNLPYPSDGGLKTSVRDLSETLSAFDVIRNAVLTTVRPDERFPSAILSNCSNGVEPYFGTSYQRQQR